MKNLIILLSCLLFAGSVYGWGQKGHDVTAYIAECHLTPEAAQKIDKVLNGHSPVYYCNWMDIASHTPEYNYTKTWHYLNIDEGQTLETMPRNPKGDVLTAVTTLVAELKAGGLAPENVSNAIFFLHPDGVDVSSGVEFLEKDRPGKDPYRIQAFAEAVQFADKLTSKTLIDLK